MCQDDRGEVFRETRIDFLVSITKEEHVSRIESVIVGIPPACQKFQARSVSDGNGQSIRPPTKTRPTWQSSTERQGTEKSCLKKVKQRWLSLDMANRQSERRLADVYLRAEGNREQVAESEKSLKVWRRRQSSSHRRRIRCSHNVGHGQDFRDRCPSLSATQRGRKQDRKPDCTSRAVEDLQRGVKIWKSWRGREPNYLHKDIFKNVKRSIKRQKKPISSEGMVLIEVQQFVITSQGPDVPLLTVAISLHMMEISFLTEQEDNGSTFKQSPEHSDGAW